MAGGLALFWDKWDIQILVVLSFTLQVILLLSAGIRRHESAALLRILLWLAYLMSDYTAIYALGHMSISSRSGDHQIMPFWAPFLLLHLGGPDTITAYAFQDNQLWLRHLLTLVVQVIGAAYVLYQFVTVDKNKNPGTLVPAPTPGTLVAAATLMFFSGCLRYGERTWALKCSGINSIASSLSKKETSSKVTGPYQGREGGKRLDTEEVLLGAHYMRNVCKGMLADQAVTQKSEYEVVRQGIQLNGGMYLYELVTMELSLLYDILYTKAAVIHTWYGLCIRIVSPLSAIAAFLLFLFSSKDAYIRVDVAVTYVLLVGALVLEMASLLRAVGSSWACASFHARGCHRLCSMVMRLRRLVKAGARRRTCLDSLGQYNLLDVCTDVNHDDLRGKIAKIIGLGDRWRKLHYSTAVPVSDSIKGLVLEELRKKSMEELRNARGKCVLKERGMYEDLIRVADETELDRSIIVWHIATDFYLSMCPEPKEEDAANEGTVRDDIRVLSNHMMFLLEVHPYLLPGVVRSVRNKENYMYFSMLWWRVMKSTKEDTMSSSRSAIVKKIGEWQLPAESRGKYIFGIGEERADDVDDGPAYEDGSWLAGMLLGNRWCLPTVDMLQVIAGVWVELLCYAAYHCGNESHATKLSTGGKFVNAVWLLMGQATLYDRFAPSAEALTVLSRRPLPKPKLPTRWTQPPPV